jgi:YtcA family
MIATRSGPLVARTCVLLFELWFLAGCSRAPSVDILGSFFPAWLVCLIPAILLAVLVRFVLSRLHVRLSLPVLVYPSIAALFTFVLWLLFFH